MPNNVVSRVEAMAAEEKANPAINFHDRNKNIVLDECDEAPDDVVPAGLDEDEGNDDDDSDNVDDDNHEPPNLALQNEHHDSSDDEDSDDEDDDNDQDPPAAQMRRNTAVDQVEEADPFNQVEEEAEDEVQEQDQHQQVPEPLQIDQTMTDHVADLEGLNREEEIHFNARDSEAEAPCNLRNT